MLGITSTNIGFSRSASDARYAKQLNPNLSGVINLSSGTTWNYANAGAITAHLSALGLNVDAWDSTYTTVQANSASWVGGSPTIASNDANSIIANSIFI